MAKYEITYTCGHSTTVQLYGKTSEREAYIEREERHECPECRAKKAQSEAKENGLAELNGSPKQVSWASDIRNEMLKSIDSYEEKLVAYAEETNQPAEAMETAKANFKLVRDFLAEEKSAKWFIDNRTERAEYLCTDILQTVSKMYR